MHQRIAQRLAQISNPELRGNAQALVLVLCQETLADVMGDETKSHDDANAEGRALARAIKILRTLDVPDVGSIPAPPGGRGRRVSSDASAPGPGRQVVNLTPEQFNSSH